MKMEEKRIWTGVYIVMIKEFGVKEPLMLEDIRVKAMIAGALADMPEFLIDQIGKASNSSNFPSMTRAMERIADVVEEKWEEERE